MEKVDLFTAGILARENGHFDEALHLFRTGAAEGNTDCMSALALMYDTGCGVIRDVRQSIYWDIMAIRRGSTLSLFNLAVSFRSLGRIRQTRRYFERSLAKGESEAALELAKLYSVSDKESATVARYLKIVLDAPAHTTSQQCREEAERMLRALEA
ncbi:tetratricopeptide repeat protein [Tahibacter amnicola]|uniref:Sel1 repeat-containing protein n=1 Tax=Tahibacter amnicola TaxID=2976241 RepID=A0ABY6BAA7_9GAMM|nr:hypothetical protein [Tahibacter amnicola]UXI66996.1 hypothetical protein N4264_19910 [Tahibacter amnicola]